LPAEFVLYGGTAVALHLGHRESVDFDFFGCTAFDVHALVPAMAFLSGATITQRAPNTLSCIVDRGGAIKVSFFGVPRLPRLAAPCVARENGVKVASLLDLAGTKASVVQLRAEAKDYLDIDAILLAGGIDLAMAISAAAALYGDEYSPQGTLKALSFFDDGNLASLTGEVKTRLMKAARDVDLDSLPAIAPSQT